MKISKCVWDIEYPGNLSVSREDQSRGGVMEVNENSLGLVYFLPEQTAALPFVLHINCLWPTFPWPSLLRNFCAHLWIHCEYQNLDLQKVKRQQIKMLIGCLYGRVTLPKQINFWKSSERGGGVISNPKIYIADFCHYKRFFGHVFLKNCNMIFRKGGGGQRPFGIFPKIHPFW